MRKQAQERRKVLSSSSSSSSFSSSLSSNCQSPPLNNPAANVWPKVETDKYKVSCDRGSFASLTIQGKEIEEGSAGGYSMEQIWKEIDSKPEVIGNVVDEGCEEYECSFFSPSILSPVWDYRYDLP